IEPALATRTARSAKTPAPHAAATARLSRRYRWRRANFKPRPALWRVDARPWCDALAHFVAANDRACGRVVAEASGLRPLFAGFRSHFFVPRMRRNALHGGRFALCRGRRNECGGWDSNPHVLSDNAF